MGDNYSTNIKSSNVGAVAVGPGAIADGTVALSPTTPISQSDYEAHLDAARKALIDDEASLEEVSSGLYEAIAQFLRIARQIQVDQMSLKDAQTKMKETLDEVWAEQVARKLKGTVLPATLEVARTLLESPVTAAIAKTMLGT